MPTVSNIGANARAGECLALGGSRSVVFNRRMPGDRGASGCSNWWRSASALDACTIHLIFILLMSATTRTSTVRWYFAQPRMAGVVGVQTPTLGVPMLSRGV